MQFILLMLVNFLKKLTIKQRLTVLTQWLFADANNLVYRNDYNTKINEIDKKVNDEDHTEHITTQEFNKLT